MRWSEGESTVCQVSMGCETRLVLRMWWRTISFRQHLRVTILSSINVDRGRQLVSNSQDNEARFRFTSAGSRGCPHDDTTTDLVVAVRLCVEQSAHHAIVAMRSCRQ